VLGKGKEAIGKEARGEYKAHRQKVYTGFKRVGLKLIQITR